MLPRLTAVAHPISTAANALDNKWKVPRMLFSDYNNDFGSLGISGLLNLPSDLGFGQSLYRLLPRPFSDRGQLMPFGGKVSSSLPINVDDFHGSIFSPYHLHLLPPSKPTILL